MGCANLGAAAAAHQELFHALLADVGMAPTVYAATTGVATIVHFAEIWWAGRLLVTCPGACPPVIRGARVAP